ncbi:MAG: glycosyltransferase family 8 protein [Puniceicoccales bacterium]|nr:glycosyltransferase family 8 protein [Puniceicoccales bacterium]
MAHSKNIEIWRQIEDMKSKNFETVIPLDEIGLRSGTFSHSAADGSGGKKIIPMVLSADNNFATQMCVTIYSLLKNANRDTFYDLHLLLSSDFEEKYKVAISEYETGGKCKVNFIDMGMHRIGVSAGYFPEAAYCRLLAADLLPNYSKCIYLDSDIVVLDDLFGLYSTDMTGFYIAGVKDLRIISCDARLYVASIGVKDVNSYVNSGVLVMNLDSIRENGLVKRFISMAKHGIDGKNQFEFPDQDILNIVCQGKIKHLDYRFNVLPSFVLESAIEANFGKEVILEAINNPSVVHFAVKSSKPWKNPTAPFAEKWWKYARKSPFYEEMLANVKHSEFAKELSMICMVLAGKYSKFNYHRTKVFSKITFGKTRARYAEKNLRIAEALRLIEKLSNS